MVIIMIVTSVKDLGPVFSGAFMEVISVSAGISFDILSTEADASFSELTGVMCLNGKKQGMFFVTAQKSTIKTICSNMTGIPEDDVTRDDMTDTLCELVNMGAGNAKLRIAGSDYNFKLSTPFAITGDNMMISTKKRVNVVSRVLGNDEMSVKIKIMY
jgi:CheY-specific phosphatase CheX